MNPRNLNGVPTFDFGDNTNSPNSLQRTRNVDCTNCRGVAFFPPSASMGNVSPFLPTSLGPTGFSDFRCQWVATSQSLIRTSCFKDFFDENLMGNEVYGLDFLPNQHIVGFSQTSPPTVTEYDTSGTTSALHQYGFARGSP